MEKFNNCKANLKRNKKNVLRIGKKKIEQESIITE